MTATLSPTLAALVAGAQPAAMKRKKGETPRITCPEIAQQCLDYPDIAMAAKVAEVKKDRAMAEIIAVAEPHRLALSRQFREPLSSVRVNGILYVYAPPAHNVVLKGTERVSAAMEAFGGQFYAFHTPIFRLADTVTPEQMAASGLPYTVEWRPNEALHEARTMNPDVAALCDSALPDVRPIQYVRK